MVSLPDATGATLAAVTNSAAVGFAVGGARPGPAGETRAMIWRSVDGTSWTAYDLGPGTVTGVAPGGDGLGASGLACVGTTCRGLVMFGSSDGIRWGSALQYPIDASGGFALAFAAAGPRFVVAGYDPGASAAGPSDGRLWTSGDGDVWIRLTPDATFAGSRLIAVSASRAGFVIAGAGPDAASPGHLWTSRDGTTWGTASADPDLAGGAFSDVAAGDHGFVAVGTDAGKGAVWTSADGSDWVRIAATFGTAADAVAIDGQRTYVTSTDGTAPSLWSSSDGKAWATVGAPQDAAGVRFDSIAVTRKGAAVVGNGSSGSHLWFVVDPQGNPL